MKRDPNPLRPCIAVAIVAAATLPLTSLAAQEAVAPAVQPTVSAPAAAPAPVPATPTTVFRPQQAVVQPTPPRPAPPVEAVAAPVETASPAPRAKRRAARPAPRRVAEVARPAPVPVVAAPVAASVTPPAATPAPDATIPEAMPAVPEAATPPVTTADPEVVSETPASSTPWLAIAAAVALIIAGLAFFFRRSRRERFEVSHASYVPTDETGAPVPEVDLAERPWIRLALQPTKWESHGGEQTVDYQLIVENEGGIAAHDVRVSSFLTGIAGASPSDALRGEQSQTHHIDVEPGQSVPLRGTVTVRDGVDPKIVADARYALPDGGEGHLAALFGIDTSNDEPEAQVEDVLERV